MALITVIVSCQSPTEKGLENTAIRLNQLGYYPASVKQFSLVDIKASSFAIVNEDGKVVFDGKLVDNGIWILSGERVLMGDFSAFNKIGSYSIVVDDSLQSYAFEIKKDLYKEPLKAAIKSYYFQRVSMPIEEQYGGIYKRAAGHPDDNCAFHPSTGHTSGTLSSPCGWYDAGDYGKYVVNAAFSVGQMLNLVEQYPDIIPDGELNIPESGNGIGDLRDEIKYELDWILTMQDGDGGVYHKLTAKKFSGFIMPKDYDLERMIIGKGTAATLDFAAVMAQASRLYKDIDPTWSVNALVASEKAWLWARNNDSIPYSNPEDVSTGSYDDVEFRDDFYWAAAELYLTTQNRTYLEYLYAYQQPYIHELTNSWKFFVRNNGFHSLIGNLDLLDEAYSVALKENHIILADEILLLIANNPYNIALNLFEWGIEQ